VGHDRGGRVAHRMALDHADRVTKLAILDIVPTYKVLHSVTNELATAISLVVLIQKAPLPETLIGNSAEVWLRSRFERIPPGVLSKEAFAEYLRSSRCRTRFTPRAKINRAGATIDLTHDGADLDHKILSVQSYGENGCMAEVVRRARSMARAGIERHRQGDATGTSSRKKNPDMLLEN